MFDNFNYRQKLVGLLILTTILAATAYKRSFRELISLAEEHRILSLKSNDFYATEGNSDELITELEFLDRALGENSIHIEEIQQGIVSFSNSHPGISIYKLNVVHLFENDKYKIVTNQIDVTGNLDQLLRLCYDFEKEFFLSRIVSLDFYTEKKNKLNVLHLKLIFQNYEVIK